MKSKTRSPNSAYYRNKADEIFMVQFRGLPCEVCGTTNMTVGHHNVNKARSKALRYDKWNITVLCQAHHTMGNDIAPHSSNPMAVDRYFKWFREEKPDQYAYCVTHEHDQRKYNYRDALENLKAGMDAWV